jgi:signal peptidase
MKHDGVVSEVDAVVVIPARAEREQVVDPDDTVVVIPEREPTPRSHASSWSYAAAHRRHPPKRGALRAAVDVTLLALAIAALAGGAAVVLLHLNLQPVLSGSMRPGIQPGDLAITRPVPASSLEPGDVIVYVPPGGDEAVMHRMTSIERRDDGLWITTKGDANDVADPWGAVRLRGDTAYRLVAVVPKAGYLPVWTRSARGPVLIAAGLLFGLSALLGARRRSGRTRTTGFAEGRTAT